MKIYYQGHRNPQVLVSWFEVIAYAATIFLISSMSHPALLMQAIHIRHIDKFLHFFEYTVFGFILFRALAITFDYGSWKRLALNVFLVGFIYALSDEIHQLSVPARSCCLSDAAIDAVGLCFGMAGWWFLKIFAWSPRPAPVLAQQTAETVEV